MSNHIETSAEWIHTESFSDHTYVSTAEIHWQIITVYGENIVSYCKVEEWSRNGCTNCDDLIEYRILNKYKINLLAIKYFLNRTIKPKAPVLTQNKYEM